MQKFFDERKSLTADFIKQYLIISQLAEVDPTEDEEYPETSPDIELSKPAPFDKEIKPRQVRLLADADNITYVLVIKKWDEDLWLCQAFSHYRSPATHEEFKPTEWQGFDFWSNVLQAWNTFTLCSNILERSWVADEVPESTVKEAMLMFNATISDIEIPDELLKRTGLPIYKREDPRLQYQKEELDNLSKVMAKDLELSL